MIVDLALSVTGSQLIASVLPTVYTSFDSPFSVQNPDLMVPRSTRINVLFSTIASEAILLPCAGARLVRKLSGSCTCFIPYPFSGALTLPSVTTAIEWWVDRACSDLFSLLTGVVARILRLLKLPSFPQHCHPIVRRHHLSLSSSHSLFRSHSMVWLLRCMIVREADIFCVCYHPLPWILKPFSTQVTVLDHLKNHGVADSSHIHHHQSQSYASLAKQEQGALIIDIFDKSQYRSSISFITPVTHTIIQPLH